MSERRRKSEISPTLIVILSLSLLLSCDAFQPSPLSHCLQSSRTRPTTHRAVTFQTRESRSIENVSGSDAPWNNQHPLPPSAERGTPMEIDPDQRIPAKFVAETNLPTDLGHYRLRAYRTVRVSEFSGNEPSVIYAADKPPFGTDGAFREDVPVRIHDQCLTSEVFRSQRCDCKEQLKMAMKHISKNGGAIIYLQQEGRGIGLANKVAAYALQDDGMDTVDANLHLGLPEDCRHYGAVPSILEDMKIKSVQLMTNNPRKIERVTSLGVPVTATVPMVVEKTNPYNHRYMEAKHNRMDHTNLAQLFVQNGNMIPMRSRDDGVHKDDAKSQVVNGKTATLEVGTTIREDGYCFGRQSVVDAIDAIKAGKMVVVVDDMNRENEGDLIMAADACTPQDMAHFIRYTSGVVCIAMTGERLDELKLGPMLADNQDPKGTSFAVTVDGSKEQGIGTGISAKDRSKTVQLLADPSAQATDLVRPGHIFPLRAREGGVLTRDGHTEAAVDLARLAGRAPAAILCEVVSEEQPTGMARAPELKEFAKRQGLVLTSIIDIAQYRRETDR